MSDLKAALAEALREHLTCDCGEWAENMDETVAHLADVLLALPGVAVTQLPEVREDDWGPCQCACLTCGSGGHCDTASCALSDDTSASLPWKARP